MFLLFMRFHVTKRDQGAKGIAQSAKRKVRRAKRKAQSASKGRRPGKTLDREGSDYRGRVYEEAVGGESGMGSLRYQAGLTATASASSYSRASVSPQPRQASVIEVP